MFDSSMSAAAIAARVQELQAAAGIKAQLVRTACCSNLCTAIPTSLYAVHLLMHASRAYELFCEDGCGIHNTG